MIKKQPVTKHTSNLQANQQYGLSEICQSQKKETNNAKNYLERWYTIMKPRVQITNLKFTANTQYTVERFWIRMLNPDSSFLCTFNEIRFRKSSASAPHRDRIPSEVQTSVKNV